MGLPAGAAALDSPPRASGRLWSRARTHSPAILNSLVYLFFSFATAALGLATAALLARFLPPAEYARIGIFISVAYFITPAISCAADGLIAVNKASMPEAQYAHFVSTYVALAYRICLAVQLVAIASYWLGLFSDALLLLVPVFALVRVLAAWANTEYVIEERVLTYGILGIATTLLSFIVTAVLLVVSVPSGAWRIAGMLTADASLLWVRYRGRLNRLSGLRLDRQWVRHIVTFGLPSLVAVGGAWALNESDKVVILRVAGREAAGLYTAACAIGAIMTVFLQSLANGLTPRLYSALNAARPAAQPRIIGTYSALFAGLATLFALAASAVLLLVGDHLLSAKYAASKPLVIWYLAACISIAVYRPFGLAADYFRLAGPRMWALLIGGAVTVCVAVVAVSSLGPAGATVGIAAGYLVAALLVFVHIRRHCLATGRT